MDQQTGKCLKHMRHLIEKGEKLYELMREAKFWQRKEDIFAGVIVRKAAGRPFLEYGSEVWACPSAGSENR